MGVVNVTPDSFSDGGRFFDAKFAIAQARALAADGADIIDIGGESSRPGAAPVSVEEELQRILPVLEKTSDLCISVDTRRPEVMQAALGAGASMINDIEALSAPGALEAVAKSNCAVCLMHKKGEPATMQRDPHYDDVVGEVKSFLEQRVKAARDAGIAAGRMVVDPGFGFGKTVAHNLELLRRLAELSELPVLAGLSRKSSLEKITGRAVGERLAGSLAMALLALQGGARILRVHDVKETRDVIAVWKAFKNES
ncbi:MAG: dihydropteroate synthase [Betaproteobacteria bacterium]|jgi:dihydropteroate synthase|nr:dihydropteroate synthase [Betaproteobacteria bacterium]